MPKGLAQKHVWKSAGAALVAGALVVTMALPSYANGAKSVACTSAGGTVRGESAAVSGGSGWAATDPNGTGAQCGNLSVRAAYRTTLVSPTYYTAWRYNGSSGTRITATSANIVVGGQHSVTIAQNPGNFPFST